MPLEIGLKYYQLKKSLTLAFCLPQLTKNMDPDPHCDFCLEADPQKTNADLQKVGTQQRKVGRQGGRFRGKEEGL